jgi:uncharacterized protein (UPF0264 family)
MAGLLVSVRNAGEARAALAGGATIIDVKEPDRGPLGRADGDAWQAVRETVPEDVPVSVALGELSEWEGGLSFAAIPGISYRKIGLARVKADWRTRWESILCEPGPAWVAVAYEDWQDAGAPDPGDVLDAALDNGCAGILLDRYGKRGPSRLDLSWKGWVERAREGGLLVALAGGLDEAAIRRLAGLRPDYFAVRGAACQGGNRRQTIDARRVARLASAVGRAPALVTLGQSAPYPGGGGGGGGGGGRGGGRRGRPPWGARPPRPPGARPPRHPALRRPHAAAELSPARIRARIASAAFWPAWMQSGTPTPSR